MGSPGCLLCRCPVPAECGEVFISHLQEEHRTFSNHNLIFLLSRLDQDGIERTLDFVSEVIGGDIIGSVDPGDDNVEEKTLGASYYLLDRESEDEPDRKDEKYCVKYEIKEEIETDEKNENSLSKFKQENKETTDLVKNLKMQKFKKKGRYTTEEKQFCADYLEELKSNEEGKVLSNHWYKQFALQFSQQFPETEAIPPAATVTYAWNKFKKFNTVENRTKGNSGRPKKSRSNVCDECGFVGNGGRQDIQRHKRSYHEKRECPDCGKSVSALQFSAHMQYHLPESERKYKCSFCGKGCITKQKLREHELIHTDERPFTCKFLCGYSCKNRPNIGKHEKLCEKRISKANFN